ncbi:MAG TPA: hypothetical protein V6D11_00970 [Waterburya sp.]
MSGIDLFFPELFAIYQQNQLQGVQENLFSQWQGVQVTRDNVRPSDIQPTNLETFNPYLTFNVLTVQRLIRLLLSAIF